MRPAQGRPRAAAGGRVQAPSIAFGRGILGRPKSRPGAPAAVETTRVNLLPWEYMFEAFSAENFPDIYQPIWSRP